MESKNKSLREKKEKKVIPLKPAQLKKISSQGDINKKEVVNIHVRQNVFNVSPITEQFHNLPTDHSHEKSISRNGTEMHSTQPHLDKQKKKLNQTTVTKKCDNASLKLSVHFKLKKQRAHSFLLRTYDKNQKVKSCKKLVCSTSEKGSGKEENNIPVRIKSRSDFKISKLENAHTKRLSSKSGPVENSNQSSISIHPLSLQNMSICSMEKMEISCSTSIKQHNRNSGEHKHNIHFHSYSYKIENDEGFSNKVKDKKLGVKKTSFTRFHAGKHKVVKQKQIVNYNNYKKSNSGNKGRLQNNAIASSFLQQPLTSCKTMQDNTSKMNYSLKRNSQSCTDSIIERVFKQLYSSSENISILNNSNDESSFGYIEFCGRNNEDELSEEETASHSMTTHVTSSNTNNQIRQTQIKNKAYFDICGDVHGNELGINSLKEGEIQFINKLDMTTSKENIIFSTPVKSIVKKDICAVKEDINSKIEITEQQTDKSTEKPDKNWGNVDHTCTVTLNKVPSYEKLDTVHKIKSEQKLQNTVLLFSPETKLSEVIKFAGTQGFDNRPMYTSSSCIGDKAEESFIVWTQPVNNTPYFDEAQATYKNIHKGTNYSQTNINSEELLFTDKLEKNTSKTFKGMDTSIRSNSSMVKSHKFDPTVINRPNTIKSSDNIKKKDLLSKQLHFDHENTEGRKKLKIDLTQSMDKYDQVNEMLNNNSEHLVSSPNDHFLKVKDFDWSSTTKNKGMIESDSFNVVSDNRVEETEIFNPKKKKRDLQLKSCNKKTNDKKNNDILLTHVPRVGLDLTQSEGEYFQAYEIQENNEEQLPRYEKENVDHSMKAKDFDCASSSSKNNGILDSDIVKKDSDNSDEEIEIVTPKKKRGLKLKSNNKKTNVEKHNNTVLTDIPRVGLDFTQSEHEYGQAYEIQENNEEQLPRYEKENVDHYMKAKDFDCASSSKNNGILDSDIVKKDSDNSDEEIEIVTPKKKRGLKLKSNNKKTNVEKHNNTELTDNTRVGLDLTQSEDDYGQAYEIQENNEEHLPSYEKENVDHSLKAKYFDCASPSKNNGILDSDIVKKDSDNSDEEIEIVTPKKKRCLKLKSNNKKTNVKKQNNTVLTDVPIVGLDLAQSEDEYGQVYDNQENNGELLPIYEKENVDHSLIAKDFDCASPSKNNGILDSEIVNSTIAQRTLEQNAMQNRNTQIHDNQIQPIANLHFSHTTEKEIKTIIDSMKPKTSAGEDDISCKMIKHFKNEVIGNDFWLCAHFTIDKQGFN